MPGTAFVKTFIDPILPSVPKSNKKQIERLLCSNVLTFSFSLLSLTFQLIQRKPLSLLNFSIFIANVFSVAFFLKAKISVRSLQWMAAVTFAMQALLDNFDTQSRFDVSFLEAFSMSSSVQYGPTFSIIVFGLEGPGLFLLAFCWIFLSLCCFVSPQDSKHLELITHLVASFALQTWLGVFYNATEKVSEFELENAVKQAIESSLMKTKFVSWLSHDLRTPLVGLNGFLEQLVETKLHISQQDLVANALSCAQSISALITHLLDFSMIESRQIKLQSEVFNLPNSLTFLHSLLSKMAIQKGLPIDVSIDPRLLDLKFVIGDWLRFQQIVTNLSVNAIKYTPAGEGNKVSVTFQIENEQYLQSKVLSLRILIEDTGIGIPASEIGNIYKPFFQVKNQYSTGAGLGLYIVSEIVQSMGGTISVRSTQGIGTVFTVGAIQFPIPDQQEVSRKLAQTIASKFRPEDAQKIHILLAEDNKINQAIFGKLLSGCHFKCTIVDNGEEAVNAWKNDPNKYQMILMDLQMPIKDGMDATRDIRSIEKKQNVKVPIPIVALTASTYPAELTKAIQSGMQETLSKPLQKHVLEECVWRTMNAIKWAHNDVEIRNNSSNQPKQTTMNPV